MGGGGDYEGLGGGGVHRYTGIQVMLYCVSH